MVRKFIFALIFDLRIWFSVLKPATLVFLIVIKAAIMVFFIVAFIVTVFLRFFMVFGVGQIVGSCFTQTSTVNLVWKHILICRPVCSACRSNQFASFQCIGLSRLASSQFLLAEATFFRDKLNTKKGRL